VIAGIALVASMALNLARGETFIAVFNAAVAFAIAAIRSGCRPVVTTILAWGTEAARQGGAIMKRLQSTETLGSTSRSTRQDRHADAEPDDRGPDGGGRPPVRRSTGKGYSAAGQITRVAGRRDPAG
jgi:Ca2+-transporting ATPase